MFSCVHGVLGCMGELRLCMRLAFLCHRSRSSATRVFPLCRSPL